MIPKLIYPVAETVYDDFFRSVQKGLVVEQSHLGQFYRLIRMFVDVPAGVEVFARSGSNPFTPGEVFDRIRQMMLAMQRQKEVDFEPAG
jgi:2-oxoglutarate ferredoxin oxidoreductase subunit alpha